MITTHFVGLTFAISSELESCDYVKGGIDAETFHEYWVWGRQTVVSAKQKA
jgi:hypothetical protein